MRNLGRLLFVLFALLIALIVILLIGANLYVQSRGAQDKIQQELSQRLGTTLHVRQISVTPWGGLKLTGIAIPQDVRGANSNFLEAESFRLRLRFLSLFSKRLVIRDVSLVNPTIVWPQNDKGKWRLPGSHLEESAERPPEKSQIPGGLGDMPVASPAPLTTAETPKPVREEPRTDFRPEIRHINVTRGSFHFLDRSGAAAATFDGVNFRSVLDSAVALHGQARIDKVTLRERFYLSDVKTPVRYDPSELALPKISASAANGELLGEFTMHPQEDESPFNVNVRFRNLQADQIVTEAGGPSGMVQGNLEGNFEAQGKTADADALVGSGEITLHDGQLRQYSLLVALGQVLQIEELTQLHLEQAQARYHVTPGLVTIDELILRSPNIRLSATGTVGFNGKLRLESQLAINDKIRNQLFKAIRQNFQPIAEPGFAAVNFQVTGTVERPKSNLMEKLVGRELKDLGSVISGFLGGSKSEKGKRKKARDAIPDSSPGESPVTESPEPSSTP